MIRGKGKDFPWHGRLNSFLDTGRDVRFTNIADFYNFLYIDTGIETEYMKNKITYQNLKNIILEYVKDKKEIIGNEYQLPWHRKLNALVDKKENGINSFDDFYNKLFEDTGIKRIKKHKSCDEMYKEIEEEVIKYVDGKKFIKGIQEQLPFHKLMFNLTLKAKKEKNEKYINNQEIYKRIYENTGIVRIKMKRALTLERLAMDIQEAVDNGFPDNKWKRDVVNYAQWHGLTLEEVMHQLGYTDFKSRKPYDFKKKL